MPAPITDITKKRVVQQWLSGDSRSKIAIDNNLGEGTVSSIVNYYKIGLDSSEFDSARQLARSKETRADYERITLTC